MSRARALPMVIMTVLSVVLWGAPAQAHNSLTASSPRDGSRVAEVPEAVTLTFLASLKPGGTTMSVTGPDGAAATAGEPAVKGNKLTVRLRAGAAGRYTVAYRVSSVDGHVVKGDIEFTATKGAAPTAGARSGTAVEPSSALSPVQSPGASSRAATVPDPAVLASAGALDRMSAEEQGPTWWPWLLGVGLLVVAGAGALLLRRRAAR